MFWLVLFGSSLSWWQELRAAGDIESVGRKQREKSVGIQLTFSFLFSQGARPWHGVVHKQGGLPSSLKSCGRKHLPRHVQSLFQADNENWPP